MDETKRAPKSSQTGLQQKEPKQHNHQQQLIPGLPDEIAMECLVRVPYQFHSNMKSVCHSWHKMVTNPLFYRERRKSNHAEQLVVLVQPLPTLNSSNDQTLLSSDTMKTPSEKLVRDQDNQQKLSHRPPKYGLTIFNVTSNTWTRTGPQDCSTVPLFSQCLALPESGKVLLLGGWDPQTWDPIPHVYVLEFIGGSYRWRLGAPMSVARSFFACAVVGNFVYVAGGHDSQKNALKSAEVYDIELDEWKSLPDMVEERDECHGLAWESDSRFWVISGYGTDSQGQFRSDAEFYDPETNSWSQVNGVWPFPGTSPRTASTTVSGNKRHHQWLWFMASGDQEINQVGEENQNPNWGTISSISVPNTETGFSPCVTTLGCSDKDKQKIFVMSGGGRRSSSTTTTRSSFSCRDCEGETFIFERCCSNGSIKWNHIHTPVGFSGFPYSACNLTI